MQGFGANSLLPKPALNSLHGIFRNLEPKLLPATDGLQVFLGSHGDGFARWYHMLVIAVEGIPSILTMTICMLNYYYTCCYVCSSRESRTVVDRGFSYI